MTLKSKLPLAAAVAALIVAFAIGSVAEDKEKKVKLKTKPYPLEVCAVSGEKLDSMGEPFVFTEGSQEIQLCCKSCQKDFTKDKAAYLKKVALDEHLIGAKALAGLTLLHCGVPADDKTVQALAREVRAGAGKALLRGLPRYRSETAPRAPLDSHQVERRYAAR